MTDKEQIKEIAKIVCSHLMKTNPNHLSCGSCSANVHPCSFSTDIAEALYNAGYLKTIWHKVADGDVPDNIRDIIIAFKLDDSIVTTTGRYKLNDFYISDLGLIRKEKVIAWTEIPTYNNEEQGLMVEPLCKIGSYIYRITGDKRKKESDKCKVVGVWLSEDEKCSQVHLYCFKNKENWYSIALPLSEFGKTLFTEKEEAEKKLKELKGEK